MAFYSSVLLVLSNYVRHNFISNQWMRIPVRELADVDFLWHLLNNILLVREMKAYKLEEELFAYVIFLFRVPECLFVTGRVKKYMVL